MSIHPQTLPQFYLSFSFHLLSICTITVSSGPPFNIMSNDIEIYELRHSLVQCYSSNLADCLVFVCHRIAYLIRLVLGPKLTNASRHSSGFSSDVISPRLSPHHINAGLLSF